MVRTGSSLILCAALLAWLLPARVCVAAEYYWGAHPDKDRLVFVLPDGAPSYNVKRIDKTRLFVELPGEATPRGGREPDFQGSERIESIQPAQGGLVVNLRTPAFGYIHFPLPEQGKVVLDLFSDPIGAKWRPPKGASPQPVVLEKTPRQPGKAAPQKTARGASPARIRAKAEPDSPQPVPSPDFALDTPAEIEAEQPRRPFFAVPYTYRGRINSGGMEDWNAELGTEPFAEHPGMKKAQPDFPDAREDGVRGKIAPRPGLVFRESSRSGRTARFRENEGARALPGSPPDSFPFQFRSS